jgi:hypothetical protein
MTWINRQGAGPCLDMKDYQAIFVVHMIDWYLRRRRVALSRPVDSRVDVGIGFHLTMFGIRLPGCAQVYGADPSTGRRRLQLTHRRRVVAQIRASTRRYKT